MQSPKTMGIYTGERLSTGAEERVVNLLSQGEPVSRIAKKCRMSVHSVMAIRERRSQAIADRKNLIAASAARLAAEGFDQLNERLRSEKVPTALLVPITGMATDKLVALSNHPLQIQDSKSIDQGPNLYERLNKLAERLAPKPRTIDAHAEPPAAQTALPNGDTISD